MLKLNATLAAAVLLAACITEPTAVSEEYGPAFDSQAQPAIVFTIPVNYQGVDMCGLDIADAVGTLHRVRRNVYDPATGQGHFHRQDHWNLTFLGRNTGWVWQWNETIVKVDQYSDDGRDTWTQVNDHAVAAGQGQVPNFDIRVYTHSVVNANGDLVVDQVRIDPMCGP